MRSKSGSSESKEDIKLPPLLCMTLKDAKQESEYATRFSPMHRLVFPGNKLSPTFLYQSSRNFESRRPRETRLPGFVPRINAGALHDYSFVHSRAFYHPLHGNKQYFTLGVDWVSEKPVQKNNPFS
jgi:hypothetical protein